MIKTLLIAFSISLFFGCFSQNSSLPITLSSPFDKDTIEDKEPTFVWQTNLTSIQNDARLSQVIVVCKIESNQTPSEAVIENNPIFYREALQSNTIQFSSTDTPLEDGNSYAWQIQFLYNGVLIQQSDVWQFTLAKKAPPLTEFIAVRLKNDGNQYPIFNKRLNVSTTESGDLYMNVLIMDEKGVQTKAKFSELIDGEFLEQEKSKSSTQTRYYSIDLKELKLKKGIYTVEWSAKKGTTYNFNFTIN